MDLDEFIFFLSVHRWSSLLYGASELRLLVSFYIIYSSQSYLTADKPLLPKVQCCTGTVRPNSSIGKFRLVEDLAVPKTKPQNWHPFGFDMVFWSSVSWRYLFTLELPEYWENKQADQTLEVLMSDLDPAVMDQFYMKDGVSANDVTRVRFTFV